jgi:hypothetical protein
MKRIILAIEFSLPNDGSQALLQSYASVATIRAACDTGRGQWPETNEATRPEQTGRYDNTEDFKP